MDSQAELIKIKEIVDNMDLALRCDEARVKLREWIQFASKKNRLTPEQWGIAAASLECIGQNGWYSKSKGLKQIGLEAAERAIKIFEKVYQEELRQGGYNESGIFDPLNYT